MEHIVQFAISIDDDHIKKSIEESAEKQIIDNLKNDIKDAIFCKNYYGNRTPELKDWVQVLIEKEIMKYKEEIIQSAVKELINSMSRTKRAKEVLNEGLDGIK